MFSSSALSWTSLQVQTGQDSCWALLNISVEKVNYYVQKSVKMFLLLILKVGPFWEFLASDFIPWEDWLIKNSNMFTLYIRAFSCIYCAVWEMEQRCRNLFWAAAHLYRKPGMVFLNVLTTVLVSHSILLFWWIVQNSPC